MQNVEEEGEKLIKSKHYASTELSNRVEEMLSMWKDLEEAMKIKKNRLNDALLVSFFLLKYLIISKLNGKYLIIGKIDRVAELDFLFGMIFHFL